MHDHARLGRFVRRHCGQSINGNNEQVGGLSNGEYYTRRAVVGEGRVLTTVRLVFAIGV